MLNTGTVKLIKKKKRNLARVSYKTRRPFSKPNYTKTQILDAISKRYNIVKPQIGTVWVAYKRRNTFLTISQRVENNAKNKLGRKSTRPQFIVRKAFSMGHLRIYKGRSRTSSVAIRKLAHYLPNGPSNPI